MATKTSILIFYRRIARNTNKLFLIASYTTLVVVNLAGLVLTFLNIFQCRPLNKLFVTYDDTQTCIPLITLYLASSPVNIITDLLILVLPIPILTMMNLPKKQKTILVVTFGLGIFVTVVDVVRVYYLQRAMIHESSAHSSVTATRGFADGVDFAYNAAFSLMWSAVEINVGIICACVPTLKPLVKRILPKLIDRSNESDPSSTTAPETTNIDGVSPNRMASIAEFESALSPLSVDSPNISPLTQPALARTRTTLDEEIDMLDFLTIPGREAPSFANQRLAQSEGQNAVYFGFVNMRRPKSMLQTGVKDSVRYCIAVTVLFFLWGFSYGLLNTLNIQIAAVSSFSSAQGLGLQSAYFGAYLFGPLTLGRYVLCRGGFKVTFIVGLCIYGTGTLMFWPSAVVISFPAFIISNFVVGFGLSILETAANPFIALCGPTQYGETRLLLAQGVQGIGSVVSQLIAKKAFFDNVSDGGTLIEVQWTYLAITLLDTLLALFFYYMPLPEATDDELHAAAQPRFLPLNKNITHPSPSSHIGKLRVVYVTLGLAVLAQFLYVGIQESLSIWFSRLVISFTPPSDPGAGLALTSTNYVLIGHTMFTISRFLFGGLCLIVRPRILLLVSFVGAVVMNIVIITFPSTAVDGKPNTIAAMCVMLWFFEGPLWPLIFALALRKLGRATTLGAALVAAGASGGAVIPWVMYGVEVSSVNVQRSFFVVLIGLVVGALLPLYLNVVPKARGQVDCVGETEAEQPDYGEAAAAGRMSRLTANDLTRGRSRDLHLPLQPEKQRIGTMTSLRKIGGEARRKSTANVRRMVVSVKEWLGSHSEQGGNSPEGDIELREPVREPQARSPVRALDGDDAE